MVVASDRVKSSLRVKLRVSFPIVMASVGSSARARPGSSNKPSRTRARMGPHPAVYSPRLFSHSLSTQCKSKRAGAGVRPGAARGHRPGAKGTRTPLVLFHGERLAKEPIVRYPVYQNDCDDDCAYENPDLVCFAPRLIRAVNPKDLADQISDHAVMREL